MKKNNLQIIGEISIGFVYSFDFWMKWYNKLKLKYQIVIKTYG